MKNLAVATLTAALLISCRTPPLIEEAGTIAVGTSRADVLAKLGPPHVTVGPTNNVERLIWTRVNGLIYNSTSLVLTNGATAQPPRFLSELPLSTIKKIVATDMQAVSHP